MSAASLERAGWKFHSSASAEADSASPASAVKNFKSVVPAPRARCSITEVPSYSSSPSQILNPAAELRGQFDAGARVKVPSDLQLFFGAAQQHAGTVAFILLETDRRTRGIKLVARSAGRLCHFHHQSATRKLDLLVIG